MNFSLVRDRYNKAAVAGYETLSDPHEIIAVTLRELHRSLGILAHRPEPRVEVRNEQMTRALTALYILQSSLDFDRGGEIAENLFRIYEFCRRQLTRGFGGDERADIAQAADLIATILDAWNEIGRGPC
jgi:flagellar protein FliS